MKKFIISIIILMSAAPVFRIQAQKDVTFKVSAPHSVVLGSQFQIQYVINVRNCTDLRVPAEFLDNFEVLFGPASSYSSSIQIINGKQTSSESTTLTITVAAKKEGAFTIGPAAIKVGNSEYKSDAFTIKVLPPDQATQAQTQGRGAQQQQGDGSVTAQNGISKDNLFMRIIISNRNVYEQEGFLVTFKIYSIYDLAGIDNPKFPEFEGFLAQDIEIKNIQKDVESYEGRNYHTYIVKQAILYPQHSGQLQIGSGKIDVELRVQVQSKRGRSIFDDFFGTYQNIKEELVSSSAKIDVKPLPSGKPASFSSAVGSFEMSSTINKTELKANEAVTVKLTIKGSGNIRILKNPEIKFPNDFEVYDPKIVVNDVRVTPNGVSGTKVIEYMAIPRYAGDFEIPAQVFSYFDPKSGTYKTLNTNPFTLHVEKDANSSGDAPVVSNFTNRENVRFLGKDIRYLKTQNIHFKAYKDIFFGSFLYVMAYLMITVLFVAFFIIYRKQMKENANIALVRTKKANKTAVKRLKQAEKLLHENKEEAFYEEVLRALWGYLSDKLNMPQSELTKDNVAVALTKYGVTESLSSEFLDIIHTCEFARYAPSKASGAMDKLFGETINAIDKMENTIKK